jgi:hypothetical protein
MAFSVSEFNSQVNKHGLAKNNLFYIRLTLPPGLGFLEENFTTRDLSFFCRSFDLPPIQYDVYEYRESGFGPSSRRPSSFNFTPTTGVFMVDSNFGVLKFFHRWMQQIVNYDVEGGHSSADPQGKRPYEFGYEDEYAATMEVIMFSGNQTNKTYTYKFGKIYPTLVGNITTAWENSAEVTVLPVTFTYSELKVDGSTTGTITGTLEDSNSLFGVLSAINTYGQAISTLKLPTSIQDAINQYTTVTNIFN